MPAAAGETLVLPWVVTGPNALGRGYRILSLSPALELTPAEAACLEGFNETAAAVGAESTQSRFLSFFPLPGGRRWLLALTRHAGLGARGPIIVTWGLVLTVEQLETLGWATAPLVRHFGPPFTPEAPPPPLRLSPDKLGAVRDASTPMARDGALHAEEGAFVMRVEPPWSAEDIALDILGEVRLAYLEGRGWTTTRRLAPAGAFDPRGLFHWIFAPARETVSGSLPDARPIRLTERGFEGAAEIPVALRAWQWLTRHVRHGAPPTGKLNLVLSRLRQGGIDPQLAPVEQVGVFVATAARVLDLEEAQDAFGQLIRAAASIPRQPPMTRFTAIFGVARGFEWHLATVDPPIRPHLLEAYVEDLAAQLPDQPLGAAAELALDFALLPDLADPTVEALSGDLVRDGLAEGVFGVRERLALSQATILSTALLAAHGADRAPKRYLALAGGLLSQLVKAPKGDAALEEALLALLANATSWRVARPLMRSNIPGRIGRPRALKLISPLARWALSRPYSRARTPAELNEALVLTVAAIEGGRR